MINNVNVLELLNNDTIYLLNINLIYQEGEKPTNAMNFIICKNSSWEIEQSGGKFMDFLEKNEEFIKNSCFEGVFINHDLSDEELSFFVNGMKLKAWKFDKYKKQTSFNLKIHIKHHNKNDFKLHFDKLWNISSNILWARNLINTPANDCYAEKIVEEVKKLDWKTCEVQILDENEMEKLHMTLALKVNAGSSKKPRVVVIKKGKNPKLAIVGKGVTFDTGGISIKPSNKMDEMIYDMAGGAAVIATAKTLDNIDCEFIAIAGFVENACDGNSQLPGDIYKSKNGKTVQILNTDAEGRLLLGDLVYYAGELGCNQIITIATLTGAVQVALGNIHAAVMGNLSQKLIECGKQTGETLWELPSDEAYNSFLNCSVADLQNISDGKGAGTIVGFKFIELLLKENTKLTHIDIASMIKNSYCHRNICDNKFYTAFGIRLLHEFVKNNFLL